MLGFGVSSARGGIKPRLQGLIHPDGIHGHGMAATQADEVYSCLSTMGGRCVVYKQGDNSEVKAEVLASGRSVQGSDAQGSNAQGVAADRETGPVSINHVTEGRLAHVLSASMANAIVKARDQGSRQGQAA